MEIASDKNNSGASNRDDRLDLDQPPALPEPPGQDDNMSESECDEDDLDGKLQSDQPPQKDHGPFLTKLILVVFVFIVLVGAVTVDQKVRRWWAKRGAAAKKGEAKKAPDEELIFQDSPDGQPPQKLDPQEELRMHMKKMQREAERMHSISHPGGDNNKDDAKSKGKKVKKGSVFGQVREAIQAPFRPVFRLLGSESGTWRQVISRRLFQLFHLAFAILLIYVIYQVLSSRDADAGGVATFASPFTGLNKLEKAVFVLLALLGIYQCSRVFYQPAWKSLVPRQLTMFLRSTKTVILRFWIRLKDVGNRFFGGHQRSDLGLMSAVRRAWEKSSLRKLIRRAVPEGTLQAVKEWLSQYYSHLVYAPFWFAVLFGFHMLYLYDPTALSKVVQTALPWVVPDTFLKGLAMPIAGQATAFAVSQPLYATIATWLIVSFGVGLIIRPWGKKKKDKSDVSRYEIYDKNKTATLIHKLTAVICIVLLLACYVPQVHSAARYLTGLPLEQAINAGWATFRGGLWVFLQSAVRIAGAVLSSRRDLLWPTTGGFIPFVFTMAWNGITILALWRIPKIFSRLCKKLKLHNRLSFLFRAATEKDRERKMNQVLKVMGTVYFVICILVSLPMVVDILLKPLTYIIDFPLLGRVVGFTTVYSYFYTTIPFLLIPPYLILLAFHLNWIVAPDTFKHQKDDDKKKKGIAYIRTKLGWCKPFFVVVGLLIFTCFYYALIDYVFNPDHMVGLFSFLDKIVPLFAKFVVWVVQALAENFAWVGPMTWTLATSAAFSILLLVLPTFLDSKVGGLLYLPAYHFIGQALMLFSIGIPNIPTGLLVAAIGLVQVLTAVGLTFRGIGRYRNKFVRLLVPWYDEYRNLVASH